MRTTQRKGDIALTQAAASFTRYGFDVSLPITESASYDMLVDNGSDIFKVQVKYSGVKVVDLRRIHSNSVGYVVKKYEEKAYDWIYIYNPSSGEYLIDRWLGQSTITPSTKDLFTSKISSYYPAKN